MGAQSVALCQASSQEAQMKPEGERCGFGFGSDKMLVSELGEPDVLLTGFVVLLHVPLSVANTNKCTIYIQIHSKWLNE